MAERVRQAIEGITFDELNLDTCITASFGVASTDGRGDVLLEELLRCADQALYQAKAVGRNTVCAVSPLEMYEEPVSK